MLASDFTTKSPLDKLENFFRLFDGTKDWQHIQKDVEGFYHPDLVVITAKGEKSRSDMVDVVQGFVEQGGKAENMLFEEEPDGKIRYAGTLVSPSMVVEIDSLGTFKDGQLIHIDPTNPKVKQAYSTMFTHKFKTSMGE